MDMRKLPIVWHAKLHWKLFHTTSGAFFHHYYTCCFYNLTLFENICTVSFVTPQNHLKRTSEEKIKKRWPYHLMSYCCHDQFKIVVLMKVGFPSAFHWQWYHCVNRRREQGTIYKDFYTEIRHACTKNNDNDNQNTQHYYSTYVLVTLDCGWSVNTMQFFANV